MRAARLIRETIELRDGRKVTLRPIRPTDAVLLVDLHQHLSADSQFYRFFGPKPDLSPAEAEYLANVDFTKRFAIVASVDEDGERLVAVGRFDIAEDEDEAEVAIVVRDDHQGVGLGRAILERLLDVARGRGIRALVGEILAENVRMLDLLRSSGLEVGQPDGSVVRVAVPVTDTPLIFRGLGIVARSTTAIADRAGRLRRRRA
jgi:RimJ/RimL family protein N-acetyltransferase